MAKKRTLKHGWGKHERNLESIRREAVRNNAHPDFIEKVASRIAASVTAKRERKAGTVPRRKMNTATTIGTRSTTPMRGY